MPEISEIAVYHVDLPLKEPFVTAKGSKTTSPAVAVEIRLSNGLVGFGSATPVKYVTGEDTETVRTAAERCIPILQGKEAAEYRALSNALEEALPNEHSARAAIEMAVIDAFCKIYGIPMYRFFGGTLSTVETDVTIPITDAENARRLAREAEAGGFHHLKIKVGGDPDEDMARVIAVSEGAPSCDIRLDANQGFSPEVAVGFVGDLLGRGVRIDMLEQPVDRDDLDGLKYVTGHTPVPVFADESVVTAADAMKLVKLDAVDGINIKLMKAGLLGALDIIAVCTAAGKELMLGSMIETGVGLATAVHLACGTGVFSRLDLDAHLLAAPGAMPFVGGFTADGPYLSAEIIPGHGSVPSA